MSQLLAFQCLFSKTRNSTALVDRTQMVLIDLGYVYMRSVRFSSIWVGSTLAWIRLNCVEFTRAQYHPGTVQFQTGSLLQVNPFATIQENQSGVDQPGHVYKMQCLSIPISHRFQRDRYRVNTALFNSTKGTLKPSSSAAFSVFSSFFPFEKLLDPSFKFASAIKQFLDPSFTKYFFFHDTHSLKK